MSKKSPQTKEIELYLAGELSPQKQEDFEKKLKYEKGLADEVELTKRVILAIKGVGFKEMIKRIHDENIDELRDKPDTALNRLDSID